MNEKEKQLLEIVIDEYVKKWLPIGSKFIDSDKNTNMAPSTIRKYLNSLEKKWYLYQPYNSAWRLPTTAGINFYLSNLLSTKPIPKDYVIRIKKDFELRDFIEKLWDKVDWVAFWYYLNDKDIYYLWLSKLLKKVNNDINKIINLVEFIEQRQIIWYLKDKEPEEGKINYSFINYQWVTIVLMYIKVKFENSDAIIWTVSSLRVDYKSNVEILQNILEKWTI